MTDAVVQPQEGSGEQVQEKQLSPVEVKAMELGWRPLEEFEGPEEDFVDAKEFVGRQPLYERLSKQGRHLKTVEQQLDALKTHYTSVKETEYKRAVAALKEERAAAFTEGDGVKYEKLGDEIETLESQAESMRELRETTPVEPQVNPVLQQWVTRNPWYTNSEYMRVYADKVGTQLYQQGVPPEEVLKKVTEAVKKEFPDKFKNTNKDLAPNTADSGGKPTKGGGNSLGALEASLTDQERSIMNTLVRGGTMTKEKYLQDLKAIKEQK